MGLPLHYFEQQSNYKFNLKNYRIAWTVPCYNFCSKKYVSGVTIHTWDWEPFDFDWTVYGWY